MLDVVIARVDLFTPLLPDTQPTTLFSGINDQLTGVVAALYGGPAGPPPTVFLGNSQMDHLIYPLDLTADLLIRAGAVPGTRALSLSVFGTAPTDAEVLARDLGPLHPGLVVFGIGAADIGTTVDRARTMPVTQTLDVGWRDGLVPPRDLEERLDRWVRTGWRLYRYRQLFHDLLLPPDEPRTPRALVGAKRSDREFYELWYGKERAERLMALREGFERAERFEDVERFIDEARGPEYLIGLRERWRTLVPQTIQLEALRRAAEHVRQAGGRPLWLLIPENTAFELDPEVGSEVRARSDEVARALRATAEQANVPMLDFRRILPPSRFLDFNHCVGLQPSDLLEPFAAQVAALGLLAR